MKTILNYYFLILKKNVFSHQQNFILLPDTIFFSLTSSFQCNQNLPENNYVFVKLFSVK